MNFSGDRLHVGTCTLVKSKSAISTVFPPDENGDSGMTTAPERVNVANQSGLWKNYRAANSGDGDLLDARHRDGRPADSGLIDDVQAAVLDQERQPVFIVNCERVRASTTVDCSVIRV
jgi:hypothetical protein